jgi:hypothetical protein
VLAGRHRLPGGVGCDGHASLSPGQLRGLPGRAKRVLTHLDDYATPVGTIAVSVGDVAAPWYHELVARGEPIATSRR